MKKILVYADSPTVATGFGTVSRNVLEGLHKSGKYAIDIFGINYHGTPHDLPYNIWPAADYQVGDPYGRQKFCNFLVNHDFDILWVLQDTFIVDFLPKCLEYLKKHRSTPFKVIMYYPIDSVLKKSWYENIKLVDYLVAYTDFGKQAFLDYEPDRDISVIHHGVNIKDYKMLPENEVKAFRQHYFKHHADKFIFMNVNRNQQRKDIPRTLQAFKEFKQHRPESVLYLHMARKDQGWDLLEVCSSLGLTDDDIIFPENMEPNGGYPREVLNMLYNCCDCVLSTTLGEGMGLAWLEAMACKKPVIMPNNTAMSEFITEDKGYLVDSGADLSHWTIIPNDNEVLRPLTNVQSLVEAMLSVYDDYDSALVKADSAYSWVTSDMLWSGKITKQWLQLFAQAEKDLVVNKKIDIKSIQTEQL